MFARATRAARFKAENVVTPTMQCDYCGRRGRLAFLHFGRSEISRPKIACGTSLEIYTLQPEVKSYWTGSCAVVNALDLDLPLEDKSRACRAPAARMFVIFNRFIEGGGALEAAGSVGSERHLAKTTVPPPNILREEGSRRDLPRYSMPKVFPICGAQC